MTVIELYFKPQNSHTTDTVCSFQDKSALSSFKWDVIKQALLSTDRLAVKKFSAKTDLAFAKIRIKLDTQHNPLHTELYQTFHSQDIIHAIIVIGDTAEPIDQINTALTKASGFKNQLISEP